MYNLAFEGDDLAGVFDWDVAGPGIPLDDVAILAWNSPVLDLHLGAEPAEVAHGLAVIAEAYGDLDAADLLTHVPVRMEAACARIEAGQRAGDPGMLRLGEVGEPGRTRARLAELADREDEMRAALRAG